MRLDHHTALDARALLPFLAARAVPGVEEVVGRGVPAEPGGRRSWTLRPARDARRRRRPARRRAGDPPPRRRPGGDRSPASATIRCSARSSAPRRAAASRGTRTRPSSRCARCSASRSRWPRRARSPGGWWRRRASRWRRRSAASRTASPPRPRWPRSTPRRCRCRAPALARSSAWRAEPFGEHLPGVGPWTAAYVALRSGDDDAFLPTDLGVKHGLAALGADPRRAASSSPRRGGRTAGSPWRTCGPPRPVGELRLGREAREPAATVKLGVLSCLGVV